MIDTILGDATLSVGFSQFGAILLLVFGLFLILAGIFTAYFGSGKSRTIGVVLLVVGVVVGVLTAYWYHTSTSGLTTLVEESLLVIIAAVAGALAAIAIFLVAIMKS
ncbi:MAG: hypothetical protein L3J95_06080 [Thermoplasmata archaeon]|jgi:hypothetical protein|nr:hypothetical protein [Thermoplasmata archaeon]MCI4359963.1 hypothetical protein [Thermoplasmata archaeon]